MKEIVILPLANDNTIGLLVQGRIKAPVPSLPMSAMSAKRRQKTQKISSNKGAKKELKSVDRIDLDSYNAWHRRRAEVRQWLVRQIADRALQIFQSRRDGK